MGFFHLLTFVFLLFSDVGGSHMRGGLMTFRYRQTNPDGSIQVDFRYKESYSGSCSKELNWNCRSGNCGNQVSLNQPNLSIRPGQTVCQSEGYMVRNVSTDKPFSLQASNCCWISSGRPDDSWFLLTSVDLGTRSDTGKPNSSPVTTIIPDLRVPQNCPTSYKLLADDPDEDIVRCRYGRLKSVECGSCSQDPQFLLDEESCTLSFSPGLPVGARVFELVLEDFPRAEISLQYRDGTTVLRQKSKNRRRRASGEVVTTANVTATTAAITETEGRFTTGRLATRAEITPAASETVSTTVQVTTIAPTTEMTTEVSTRQETTIFQATQNSLSKIPLQFAIEVTAAVPSCTSGVYRPMFQDPTPRHGDILIVQVGKIVQLPLSARASMDRIENFKISGPFNIAAFTYDNFTKEASAVLEWTPSPAHLNEHVPLCFVAETSGRFQSELRCVVIWVRTELNTGEGEVTCSEETMTATIPKEMIKGLQESQLHLNDPRCPVASNGSHIIAVVELSSCGTQVEETENDLIFRNSIISMDHPDGVITRKNLVQIPLSCSFPKKGTISNYFQPVKSMFLFSEVGFGSFNYLFNFFKDSQYTQKINPSSYPLEVQLRKMLYIEIRVASALSNIELFVESCQATPNNDPKSNVSYPLIQNGCFADETMVNISKSQTAFRFGVEAFSFIGNYPQVYITCTVMVCKAGEENTRCAQGCTSSGATGSLNPHRGKRSLTSETQRHFISQGPLHMRKRRHDKPGRLPRPRPRPRPRPPPPPPPPRPFVPIFRPPFPRWGKK